MQGLSYRRSNDYISYDPLQKCYYRIVNGRRIWQKEKPLEVFPSKKGLNFEQLHISL